MSVQTAPPESTGLLTARAVSPSRRIRNHVVTAFAYTALIVAAVPLLLVIVTVVRRAAGVISFGFLWRDLPVQARSASGGIGPAVVGTLVITATASLMAIPLGILAAVYLSDYGGNGRLARVIRFWSDVMAGVPSIVMGLFVFAIWVIRFKQQSGFAGALALAFLMLPIVIRSAESMLRLVPRELREASYALGCRKSRAILTVVLPSAAPGIVSGSLLAIARAAGETAPLLFTIFSNASTSFAPAQQRAWAAALTLMALVVILSTVARIVTGRFTKKF
ncbi:MAG: phosphate ABC transporter permease PstA [Actinobacteria bacterium]|nr:MAG: phosphate ABC transporter permease PstA [Actinomycetota bacterium]